MIQSYAGHVLITLDDKKYEVLVDNLETVMDHNGMSFHAKGMWRPINKCDHCHRFDVEEIVLHSFEELIENGWIKEIVDA